MLEAAIRGFRGFEFVSRRVGHASRTQAAGPPANTLSEKLIIFVPNADLLDRASAFDFVPGRTPD